MDPHSFIARAEAQRWLGIAEKLLMGHDLVGSKTFAIRARDSDPRLEAADQILAIADTLLAAEKRVVTSNGGQQPDFYAILQLVRFVQDTDHIASQYRRLAVMLNPHQNRFPYSDQAFQVVNEAWAVLSNPMRKSMYDAELDFPPQQQQMNTIGFNIEQQQQQQHQHQHQQQQQHHHQQQQHNFFSLHEQEMTEQPPTFQTRVQQSHQQQQQQQQQQLQQHNFLSQPNPVRPLPNREQEQLFQPHREQEQLFQPQVQPFQITSSPQHHNRPQSQPPQRIQSPTAASPQHPFSWPQAPPMSQPQQKPSPHQPQLQPKLEHPQQQHLQPQSHLQQQLQQKQRQDQLQREQQRQEQLQKEQQRQEQLRLEQQRQEELRLEQQRQEELRLEQQRREELRLEQQRQEELRLEQKRQEEMRIEQKRQEEIRLEQLRQEELRKEQLQQELRQEQLLQEQLRQEHMQQEQQRQEQLRQQEQQRQQTLEQNTAPDPDPPPNQFNVNNGAREETQTETETETAPEEVDDSPTFWTSCPFCFYMYEYPKVYTDCTLRCDHCERAFQAVRIAKPPPITQGQDACFYCWGYFPVGVSISHLEKTNTTNWTPFSPLCNASSNVQNHLNEQAAPKENLFVATNKSSGPRIYFDDVTDDVFIGVSDPSDDDDSDGDWNHATNNNTMKKRMMKKDREATFKERSQVLAIVARDARNGNVHNTKSKQRIPIQGGVKKDLSSSNPRRQSGRIAANELGKLDLNVEFDNTEGNGNVNGNGNGNDDGNGEEENMEGIGFFEGLDEFLSSLPILSVANEEKVMAA